MYGKIMRLLKGKPYPEFEDDHYTDSEIRSMHDEHDRLWHEGQEKVDAEWHSIRVTLISAHSVGVATTLAALNIPRISQSDYAFQMFICLSVFMAGLALVGFRKLLIVLNLHVARFGRVSAVPFQGSGFDPHPNIRRFAGMCDGVSVLCLVAAWGYKLYLMYFIYAV